MSDLDKTSKQLISSIRKTKAGPETAAVESAKKKTTTPKKAAKPKVSSTKSTKPKKRATAAKKASPKPVTSAIDQLPYPDGSQVWPD